MKRPKLKVGFYLFLLVPAIVCFAMAIIATVEIFMEGSLQYLIAEGFFLIGGCEFAMFSWQCKIMEDNLRRRKLGQ